MKLLSLILTLILVLSTFNIYAFASDDDDNYVNGTNNGAEIESGLTNSLELSSPSALLMEAETGAILYSKNPNEALAPASVTKVMTLLLVAEAIKDGKINLNDPVTVSAEATAMGGSQVFLREGEVFSVAELLTCTVIASANDAAYALAEYVGGNESGFVNMMNIRAKELGMKQSSFENVTGLDDTTVNHKTSAMDIAIMSRELIKHSCIMKYSSVWQDSIRDGEFILTNTNRLVRYYQGCTGLKTGSTDKAGFCISATAERNGIHLIAVIMGAETRDNRNNDARALLDFGFSNFTLYREAKESIEDIDIIKGKTQRVTLYSTPFTVLLEKGSDRKIEKKYEIPDTLTAPHKSGDKIGEIVYYLEGEEIGRTPIVVCEDVEKISFFALFGEILKMIFS